MEMNPNRNPDATEREFLENYRKNIREKAMLSDINAAQIAGRIIGLIEKIYGILAASGDAELLAGLSSGKSSSAEPGSDDWVEAIETNLGAADDENDERINTRELKIYLEDIQNLGEQFIDQYLELALDITLSYPGRNLIRSIDAANAGLEEAKEHYDWKSGVDFESFAPWWVRRALLAIDGDGPGGERLRVDTEQAFLALRESDRRKFSGRR